MTRKSSKSDAAESTPRQPAPKPAGKAVPNPEPVEEIGGRKGPDPTRYGDYEKDGRCVDF